MRLKVLLFHPEGMERVEELIRSLFPERSLTLEFVYPALPLLDEEVEQAWESDVHKRWQQLPHPLQVLELPLPKLVEEILYPEPPALVVVAFRRFSDRISSVLLELSVRSYPTLVLAIPE